MLSCQASRRKGLLCFCVMRRIDEIILHCSATREGKDFTVADIDRWHRERGFDEIGYHYVIYRDGSVHKGRAINKAGAHCLKHNANSVGVCYIGGLASDGVTPKDTRTPLQRAAMEGLVRALLERFPGARVCGHNELAAKACPSFDVRQWLAETGIRCK